MKFNWIAQSIFTHGQINNNKSCIEITFQVYNASIRDQINNNKSCIEMMEFLILWYILVLINNNKSCIEIIRYFASVLRASEDKQYSTIFLLPKDPVSPDLYYILYKYKNPRYGIWSLIQSCFTCGKPAYYQLRNRILLRYNDIYDQRI